MTHRFVVPARDRQDAPRVVPMAAILLALALVFATAVVSIVTSGCSSESRAAALTALDVARVACNAAAEAKAVELAIPKEEAFERFCNTRDAIAPWVDAARHAAEAIEAGVVFETAEAGASDGVAGGE